ncbi:MAG: hypothetical protein P1P84_02655 [Deferrisomatales bacterium]|nr:hypothetical protein [Deferrisomatales bacterium]
MRKNFDELRAFFETMRVVDIDSINDQVATIVFNQDRSNDRNAAAITAPTIAADGTAVDHTVNTDSTCNLSFEWAWTGTDTDTDIDGWLVYVRSSTSNAAYVIGTTPDEEQVHSLPPNQRFLFVHGAPINRYYTFGVQAIRNVDLVIAPGGLITTLVIQPSLAAENPYLPSANVAFAGDVTGTLDGTSVSVVVSNAMNAATALTTALLATEAVEPSADGAIVTWFQDAAPSAVGEAFGDIWVDTDGAVPVDATCIYRYEDVSHGSAGTLAWRAAPLNAIGLAYLDGYWADASSDGKITTFYSDSAPTGMDAGDSWVDTTAGSNSFYIWSGATWLTALDAGIVQAIAAAATAQAAADGAIVSFYQSTEPSGAGESEGDIWFDTNDKNKIYIYESGVWVARRDSDIAQAILDASDAQATADGKVVTFYSAASSPPTTQQLGDLWYGYDAGGLTGTLSRWDGSIWRFVSNYSNGDLRNLDTVDTTVIATGAVHMMQSAFTEAGQTLSFASGTPTTLQTVPGVTVGSTARKVLLLYSSTCNLYFSGCADQDALTVNTKIQRSIDGGTWTDISGWGASGWFGAVSLQASTTSMSQDVPFVAAHIDSPSTALSVSYRLVAYGSETGTATTKQITLFKRYLQQIVLKTEGTS